MTCHLLIVYFMCYTDLLFIFRTAAAYFKISFVFVFHPYRIGFFFLIITKSPSLTVAFVPVWPVVDAKFISYFCTEYVVRLASMFCVFRLECFQAMVKISNDFVTGNEKFILMSVCSQWITMYCLGNKYWTIWHVMILF